MKTSRTIGCAITVALVAATGCSHPSEEAPPVVAAPAEAPPAAAPPVAGGPTAQPQAVAPSRTAGRHPMDPAAALLKSTDQLGLSEGQQATVRTLEASLEASGRGLGAAFQRLNADLAAQVRVGTIDPAHVQTDEAAITSALQSHITQEIEALNRLHATLDPAQRAAAVNAVRSAQAGSTEEQARPSGPAGPAARLDRLTQELGLDADQQQQVAGLLSDRSDAAHAADRAQYEQRFDQVLTAFANEDFDARATLGSMTPAPADVLQEQVETKAAFLSKLVPILRPDQREKLATKLEEHHRMGGAGNGD